MQNKTAFTFNNIYLVQSYPSVNTIVNKVSDDKSSCLIIVIGNKSLEIFLKDIFINNKHIKILRFGNYNILYSKFQKLFYPFHLILLRLSVNSFLCENLFVTFKDWGDIGLIQLTKIKSVNKFYLNPYETQQFTICDRKPKSIKDYFYLYFHRLFIGKNLTLKSINPKLNRKSPLIGITDTYFKNKNFLVSNLDKEDVKNEIIETYQKNHSLKKKGIIFIEKDLFANDLVSSDEYWSFVRSIVSQVNSIDLEVYLKFKPRNNNKLLEKKYKKYGMKILPHYVPLQFFYGHSQMLLGLGFTSSGMAYGEEFKIISFAKALKINDSAKDIVQRSIENTLKRAKSKKIFFPESVDQIIKEIKEIQNH